MRQAVAVSTLILAALTLGAASHPWSPVELTPARFFFPAAVMLRGGSLRAPIAFSHAGATFGGVLTNDTVAMLYESLRPYTPKSADKVRHRRSIEVAEFFGAKFSGYASGIQPPPAFDEASYHSRIYLARGGEPALWENPVVAPGGAQHAFYALGDAAIRALEH